MTEKLHDTNAKLIECVFETQQMQVQHAAMLQQLHEQLAKKENEAKTEVVSHGLAVQTMQLQHAAALQSLGAKLSECIQSKDNRSHPNKEHKVLHDELTTQVAQLTKAVAECERRNHQSLQDQMDKCTETMETIQGKHQKQNKAHADKVVALQTKEQEHKQEIHHLEAKVDELTLAKQTYEYDEIQFQRVTKQLQSCRQAFVRCQTDLQEARDANDQTHKLWQEVLKWREIAGCGENDVEKCLEAFTEMKKRFGR